jgi:hypothetical protein
LNATNISQSFESSNSVQFSGKSVTFSFYARAGANYSAASSALTVTVRSGTGADQNIANGFTGSTNVFASSATLTTTWQRFTFTGTVAASATQLGWILGFTPVGTAGAADYFEVTGIQLEAGSVATPFEFEDVGTTLRKCQRYFETQDWSGNTFRVAVVYADSQTANSYFMYETKRAAPSFSWSGNGSVRYVYTNGNVGGSQTLSSSVTSVSGSSFGTSGTFNNSTGWIDSGGTLSISAEL